MKRFRYKINDDLITKMEEEINGIPYDFIESESSFGHEKIYYKIEGTKITEVISEGLEETAAKRRAEDFLSALNMNLF